MTTETTVLQVLLRDDLRWDGARVGLDVAPDGALGLTRVPAPAEGNAIRLPGPYETEPSGIAVDNCGRIYVSDAEAHRLHLYVPDCDFHYALRVEGEPAGLAVHGDTLYCADSANARILCFLTPSLELRRVIGDGNLREPTGLALDKKGRLYVLDRGTRQISRYLPNGAPDAAYNAAMAAQVSLVRPAFLTLGADNILYVSDAALDAVLAFDESGALLEMLAPSAQPRALAASDRHLFAADAASGNVAVYEIAARAQIGEIPAFRAAVGAMALDKDGNLFLKHDAGANYVRLEAGAGCVEAGTVTAGPLDAGTEGDWERVVADADGTTLELRAIAREYAAPPPSAVEWDTAMLAAYDALLQREGSSASRDRGKRRFLWLRATLKSVDARASPRLRQLRAQSVGESLIDKLPRIYRRDDAKDGFLERLLALARSEFEDWDAALEDLPRRFDPKTVPVQDAEWVASWLAFTLPAGLAPGAVRKLIARLPQLYARRGTVSGIRDFAEIYSGWRPRIFEAHRERRIWQLAGKESGPDGTSVLGCDTALAAAAPEGIIVPGNVRTDPAYRGLRGDYYAGYEFDRHVMSRTDPAIEFGAATPLTLVQEGATVEPFSVRWSGQIKPRHSETYLFSIAPAAGVRLWIDGYPLIDDWNDPPSGGGRIYLESDRWHAIMLEVHRTQGGGELRLAWSSRSQPEETISDQYLYSVLDDRADLSVKTGTEVEVGSAVVGESGPLAGSEYGSMLFSDYAHLFTVLVHAGCCDAHKRETLRATIDAEKPAHTDYHLCFVEPNMRVGLQARLGIDAVVAEGPLPLHLGEGALGRHSYLAPAEPGGARVASRARLGQDTVVG